MPPDPPRACPRTPLESLLCLNQLEISPAEKNARGKSVGVIAPPLSKFLASPLRRDESDRCSLRALLIKYPRAFHCLNPALHAVLNNFLFCSTPPTHRQIVSTLGIPLPLARGKAR